MKKNFNTSGFTQLCHPEFISGSRCFEKEEEMLKRVQHDKMSAGGFTLIELLVVVLIIGILAAVALPQYKRSVQKARATEAIMNLNMIRNAEEVYFMQHGEYATDLTLLDISIQDGYYHYRNTPYPSGDYDLYAIPINGTYPVFERVSGRMWCRGGPDDCKPFSTQVDPFFGNRYWIMSDFSV